MTMKIIAEMLITYNINFFIGGFLGAFTLGLLLRYDSTKLLWSSMVLGFYLMAEIIVFFGNGIYLNACFVLLGTICFGSSIGFLCNYFVSKALRWIIR